MRKSKRALSPPQILLSDSHVREDRPYKLLEHILTFGSVLTAVITLLTTQVNLPAWAITVIVIYLISVIAFIFVTPIKRLIACFNEKWRGKTLAKIFYPQLIESAKEFFPLIDERVLNNIYSFLQVVNSWSEAVPYDATRTRVIQFDAAHILTIREWLGSIKEGLDIYTYKQFPILVWDFSILVSRYHSFCLEIQNKLEVLVAQGTLNKQRLSELKQQWNLVRENEARFLKKWEALSKKINDAANERICVDSYFPDLKTLE